MDLPLDGNRRVIVGIAAKSLFIVAVDDREALATRTVVHTLRTDVERMVDEARVDMHRVKHATPPFGPGGGSGSGSGPAELPHVEFGITVPRRRRN